MDVGVLEALGVKIGGVGGEGGGVEAGKGSVVVLVCVELCTSTSTRASVL